MPSWNTTEAKFELIEKVVGDARVVFDVGAKFGDYSRRYLEMFPNAKVYAFEPFPMSYTGLENLAEIDDRLIPHQLALLDMYGEVDLNVTSPVGSCSTLSLVNADYEESDISVVTTVKVQAERLDSFCAANNISHIDFLKIDTNGTDLKVLEGAKDMLVANAIDVLSVEFVFWPYYEEQGDHVDIIKLLESHGLHLIAIFPTYWKGTIRYADAIFIKEEFKL